MNNITKLYDSPIKQYRIILIILFVEVVIYFFCNIQIASFQKNTFIGFEQDPLLWFIYFTGLPQLIVDNIYISYFIDVSIVLLLTTLFLKPLNNGLALVLFVLFFLFYCIFTAHLGHRNYQSGYLMVLLPFLFARTQNKQIVFEFSRYFLLFFYVSAAYFKIKSGSLLNSDHLSHAVTNQFTPYFLDHSYSLRTSFNLILITHNNFAQFLYFGATIFELIVIVGFFTKRYDHYLATAILIFHCFNWFIMDIAPVGQIAFICTLYFSRKFSWQN